MSCRPKVVAEIALVGLAGMLSAIAFAAQAAAPSPVTMQVDVSKTLGALPPIWRFFGADEPNYATLPQGKHLLTRLGSLRPGQVYFRAHNLLTSGDGRPDFKWGSTNLYTEKDALPVYDFKIVDGIIDSYIARGVHPYLEIGFMPQALSAAPSDVPYRRPWRPGDTYKGITAGWSYPPRDFDTWAELIYQWTRHSVERYGRAEVERWYFEVWNEANLDFYWSSTAENFYRLHDYAIEAVRRALPTARVGGPDVAGSGGEFMDGFLRHVETGTNYATGQQGTPTDFISFHAKGQPTMVDGHVRMGISAQLKTVDEAFAKIAALPGLSHKPIVIAENDPEGCAACPGSQNAYRNGTLYSSYTAASYARIWELARRRQVNLEGALTWAFTFVDQAWFAGFRQLATNDIDLPVLNVFRLFSRLGAEQLSASSSAQAPLDQIISEGVRGAPDVGVLATRAENGRLDILLWHYHDDDVPAASAAVHITLSGLAAGLERHARIWRIDASHGNAFAAWLAMGSPRHPRPAQINSLARAAKMTPQVLPIAARGHHGELSFNRSLPLQSVELIEIGR